MNNALCACCARSPPTRRPAPCAGSGVDGARCSRKSDHQLRGRRAAEGAVEQRVEHAEGGLGLIHRHHVASLVDAYEVEVVVAAHLADLLALHRTGLLAAEDEGLLDGGVELRLVRPIQRESPLLVSQPIANEVLVACVDQDVQARGKHRGDQLVVVPHEVEGEEFVENEVALLKFHVHAELLLDALVVEELGVVGHVVAQRAHGTLDAHVVWVPARRLVGQLEGQVAHLVGRSTSRRVDDADLRVASTQGGLAQGHGSMKAGAGDRAVDGRWRIATAQAHHVRIPLVLLHWICEAVADGHALEVDVLVALLQVRVALEDAMCDSRDVVTSVALARDVEVLVVLRHGLEKHLQELVHVLGNTVLVVVPCAL
mmetsp:Transcript_11232/g.39827  ORF Transcript_11232/g.39827 Transcript_11232/m.39827 type:complete len:371 (+) Transcript_11232:73-1185(+)